VTPLLPLPVPPVSFLLSPPQMDQTSRASIHHIGPPPFLLYFLPRTLVLNSPLTSSLLASSVPPARIAFKTLLFLSLSSSSSLPHSPTHPLAAAYTHIFLFSLLKLSLSLLARTAV